ncbi:MAG: hypothetical protein CMO01_13855 [Thalassobius sp.]|nr:hypothetical protein [Thalassovita sp.]
MLYILPKLIKQEFLAELKGLILGLKNRGFPTYWINFIILLNFSSVVWHVYKFKLTNYFYKQAFQEEKTEIIK